MIQWLNAVASLVTLGGVATLIGLMVHFSKEWKDVRELKHGLELAAKDLMIKQVETTTYAKAASESKAVIDFKERLRTELENQLNTTKLEEQEKADLLQRMELTFSSEQRVLTAVLDIGSQDPLIRLNAARELLRIRDPRTIPVLVKAMKEERGPSPTKWTVAVALKEFGEKAVPYLIDEVREYARMVNEVGDPSLEGACREVVLESPQGRLLVSIGAASIPSLQDLRKNEGLLGEAAGALLSAIEHRQ